jgi:hypothetical protein
MAQVRRTPQVALHEVYSAKEAGRIIGIEWRSVTARATRRVVNGGGPVMWAHNSTGNSMGVALLSAPWVIECALDAKGIQEQIESHLVRLPLLPGVTPATESREGLTPELEGRLAQMQSYADGAKAEATEERFARLEAEVRVARSDAEAARRELTLVSDDRDRLRAMVAAASGITPSRS